MTSPPYKYKEYWIDPQMGRPWTWLEENFMRKIVAEFDQSIESDYVYSQRLRLFWPQWLVDFVVYGLIKRGYIITDEHEYYSTAIYKLTNFGQCMYSKKRAYEM